MANAFYHLHEYLRQDGTVSLIGVTADHFIFESTDDGDSWTDISGDLSGLFSTLELQFANLNGDLYIGVRGHRIHRYTTALGSFTDIATSPISSGSLISTFGRLWAGVDASSTIAYCGLLDGTDWVSTGAGNIDASNAWTGGFDRIEALASFGATLCVFGRNHILLYVDGAGSELGVDPNNLYVVDTIEGTGTQHQDSVITIGEGDLWFLGPQGVQSLNRVIQDKVNPLIDVSKNQRSLVQQYITQHTGNPASVKAIYSAENRFVLFLFPESDAVLHYDTRFPLDDGTWRASTWSTNVPYTGAVVRRNGDLLFGGDCGNVLLYDQYKDDFGGTPVDITMTYASPWLNFGQQAHNKTKIIKEFYLRLNGSSATSLSGTARWGVDFRPLEFDQAWTSAYVPSGAEFGIAEWGNTNFANGLRLRQVDIAGKGEGQVVQFFTTLVSSENELVQIQEVGVRTKLGADE